MHWRIFYFLLIFCFSYPQDVNAQYPHYINYDDEKGLPSNEVYSIAQDAKGFIWVGCDAGLFRYDGFRYQEFKCPSQLSNSKSGLVFTTNGTLFCYNFKNQLFFVDDDQLKELKHRYNSISAIVTDESGNVIINHFEGVSVYNEKSGKWRDLTYWKNGNEPRNNPRMVKPQETPTTNHHIFVCYHSICTWDGKMGTEVKNNFLKTFSPVSTIVHKKKNWIFSLQTGRVFHYENGKVTPYIEPQLINALKNRKITGIKELNDDNLWIFTYEGVIRYNTVTKKAAVFYPYLAFSDGFFDREGNLWLSTLQSGIIRIPNLSFLVWNKSADILQNERINKLAIGDGKVFFGAVNGLAYQLDLKSNEVQTFSSGLQADIQSFNYNSKDKTLLFNISNNLFSLKNNSLSSEKSKIPAIKSLVHLNNLKFFGSSHGFFFENDSIQKIESNWVHEIEIDIEGNEVWTATNAGLFNWRIVNNKPVLKTHLFKGVQIRSIDFDPVNRKLYVHSFNGDVFEVTRNHEYKKILSWSKGQIQKVRYHNGQLLLATNKGLGVFNKKTGKIIWKDNQNGLASNNILDLVVFEDFIWLATGKGLQRLPISLDNGNTKANVFVNYFLIDKDRFTSKKPISFEERKSLKVSLTAIHFNSNGTFQYAFSINNGDWELLPGSTRSIPFDNLPVGPLSIQIRVVDQFGEPISDSIILKGEVFPKLYKRWWFLLLISIVVIALIYSIIQILIKRSKRKAQRENELNLSKLTAIQSQMNPHFLFNSLNSIQDLVLKGDVENSYTYITKFANLVRKTLKYSEKEFISLSQEIELLEIYLTLEQLRFVDQFTYSITADKIPDGIRIPPLIVQPFVENALVHGLLHKKGEKHLKIHFFYSDILECTIEDNGIGREKSKLINERQRQDHESFASKAMKKRFELLGHLMEGDFGYKFEDLNINGESHGTIVHLKIPVQREF